MCKCTDPRTGSCRAQDAHLRIALRSGANKGFQFKTHPNIDKPAFSADNVLGPKDPSRPFPINSELGVLKWHLQSKDDKCAAWPTHEGVLRHSIVYSI